MRWRRFTWVGLRSGAHDSSQFKMILVWFPDPKSPESERMAPLQSRGGNQNSRKPQSLWKEKFEPKREDFPKNAAPVAAFNNVVGSALSEVVPKVKIIAQGPYHAKGFSWESGWSQGAGSPHHGSGSYGVDGTLLALSAAFPEKRSPA
jgi:hypothetical protein